MALESRRRLNQQAYEEASEWFVRFRTGSVDEPARREFDQCLRGSPEFLRAYLEMTAIWNEAERLDAGRRWDSEALIAAARAAADEVIPLSSARAGEFGSEQPERAREQPRPRPVPGRRWTPWAIGAGLAAAIALVVVGTLYRPGAETFATATGEQRLVTLADGSTAELNTQSKIEVRYGPRERDVRLLKGEALFHVAKNAARPFIVGSGAARVRAVGTEFDVYAGQAETIVSVVEGRVEVEVPPRQAQALPAAASEPSPAGSGAQAASTLLPAGYRLVVTGSGRVQATPVDTAAAIAWTQHQLVFDSDSVANVAAEFNRYNARQLLVEGTLRDVRVSGVFATTNPMAFVRFLQDRFRAQVSESDTEIRVRN
jgi:transmembrane sensor